MTFLDFIIVGFLIYSAAAGALRGLARVIFDFAAVLVAAAIGLFYYQTFAHWISDHTTMQPHLATSLSFGIILIGAFLLLSVVTAIMTHSIDAAFLGPLNWVGGMAVGFVKGAFWILLLLLPLSIYNSKAVAQSIVARPFQPLLAGISDRFFTELSAPGVAPQIQFPALSNPLNLGGLGQKVFGLDKPKEKEGD